MSKKNSLQKNIMNLKMQLKLKQKFEKIDSDDLKFGTAGLRGLIGSGLGKINIYTIYRATLAFIKYLRNVYKCEDLKKRGVVIGHDNRHFSKEFTKEITDIFTSHRIKVILFKNNDVRPTPLVSYSIRKLNAIAGIVITASHNSYKYNGYKIYDEYGCQFLPNITNIIEKEYLCINEEEILNFKLFPDDELISYVSQNIEKNYIDDVKNMQFYPNEKKRNVKIIFSNLHGTSKDWTPRILKECGYKVFLVEEQSSYDPNFTYSPNPNPELIECYDLALRYAKEIDADLIILNDPDADRMGIAIKIGKNNYYLMKSNETAPVLIEYLFFHYKKFNMLSNNGVIYNTFVTGDLSDKIAKSYGVKVIKTLTGFKWIGSRILSDKNYGLKFLFAFEEACGYLIRDIIYDKDGIQSSLIVAEACWYFKNKNKNLFNVLNSLYDKFGYYFCDTLSFKKTDNNKLKINNMLKTIRNEKKIILDDFKCIKMEDYLLGLYDVPIQDLLKFYFDDGSWLAIRSSGTEPKIKFYFVCIGNSIKQSKYKMKLMLRNIKNKYFVDFN